MAQKPSNQPPSSQLHEGRLDIDKELVPLAHGRGIANTVTLAYNTLCMVTVVILPSCKQDLSCYCLKLCTALTLNLNPV